LHIGLETVFGEILPVANLSDIVGIGQFILNRFLSNPDILAQFAHPTGIFQIIFKHVVCVEFMLPDSRSYLIQVPTCLEINFEIYFSSISLPAGTRECSSTIHAQKISAVGLLP
jgi:hypothetical protein